MSLHHGVFSVLVVVSWWLLDQLINSSSPHFLTFAIFLDTHFAIFLDTHMLVKWHLSPVSSLEVMGDQAEGVLSYSSTVSSSSQWARWVVPRSWTVTPWFYGILEKNLPPYTIYRLVVLKGEPRPVAQKGQGWKSLRITRLGQPVRCCDLSS